MVVEKTKNYFIEEIKQNELIRKKHKKVYKILDYIGSVSISALASLVGIPVGFAITIKIL